MNYVCPECEAILENPKFINGYINCPYCDTKMTTIQNIVHDTCISKMKHQILENSPEKCWNMIEKCYIKPETRIRVRQIFFKALQQLNMKLKED